MVRTLAGDGSVVTTRHTAPSAAKPGAVTVSMKTTRPKTARDASAYRRAGRSVMGDLVALGMSRAEAQRQFGDMETLAVRGVRQPAAEPAGLIAGCRRGSSTATPYDTQCAAISVAGRQDHRLWCATFFLVRQDGADWWLTSKMKVSARSSDESWFSPEAPHPARAGG